MIQINLTPQECCKYPNFSWVNFLLKKIIYTTNDANNHSKESSVAFVIIDVNKNDSEIWLCTMEIEDIQSTENKLFVGSGVMHTLFYGWNGIVYWRRNLSATQLNRGSIWLKFKTLSFDSSKISLHVY